MTDLEDRLRALAAVALPDPAAPGDLRRRAARRTRRRRAVAVAVPLVLVAAIGTVVAARPADRVPVTSGTGPSTTDAPTTTSTAPAPVLGGIDGVELTVSPRTELRDGDRLQVRVTGFQQLRGAVAVTCAGTVTAKTATRDCDLDAASPELRERGNVSAGYRGEATVTATRVIYISRGSGDPNTARAYDCATEPDGCVLVVAPLTLPARGVGLRITFADVALPSPSVSLDRATGLRSGDRVSVTAVGLRPNTAYRVANCRAAANPGGYASCDDISDPDGVPATTDGEGRLTATVSVLAGLYPY